MSDGKLSEPAALAALQELYREVDAALDGLGGPCGACGTCCQFAEYGHVPMCTELEAALLSRLHGPPPQAMSPQACGYLQGSRCTAREGRPLPCRAFLCRRVADRDARERRAEICEQAHGQVRRLCRQWPRGYQYRPLWEF
jgi:hypothetical protein